MKKKAALLLAFVMVLSLLPMNVFGAPRPLVAPANATQTLTIDVPFSALANFHTLTNAPLVLDVVLGGGNHGNVYFTENTQVRINQHFDLIQEQNLGTVRLVSGSAIGVGLPGQETLAHNIFGGVRAGFGGADGSVITAYDVRLGDTGGSMGQANRFRIARVQLGWWHNGAWVDHIPGNVVGTFQLEFTNVVLNYQGANATVRRHGWVGGILQANVSNEISTGPIFPTGHGRDITFSFAGQPTRRNFAYTLAVPTISIHENSVGNFFNSTPGSPAMGNEDMVIRLQAPPHFVWQTGAWADLGGMEIRSREHGVWVAGTASTFGITGTNRVLNGVTSAQRPETINGQPHSVLYITIPARQRTSAGIVIADTFEIHNLRLVPEARAPYGPIDINIATINPAAMTATQTGGLVWEANLIPSPTSLTVQTVTTPIPTPDGRNVSRQITIPVGFDLNPAQPFVSNFDPTSPTGVGQSLPTLNPFIFNTAGQPYTNVNQWGVTRFRMGTLEIANRIGETISFARRFPEAALPDVRTGYLGLALGNRNGVQTAEVELRELVPGAWGVALGTSFDFRFEHPGVNVIGVNAQAGWNADVYNIFNSPVMRMTTIQNQWPSNANLRLDPAGVSVTIPGVLSGYNQFTDLRTLRLTFYISVEAGFEDKYPGDELLEVTVSGSGVTQLTNRSVVVARAADPISIELPDGAIAPQTDIMNRVVNQEISDILIHVEDPSSLRHGSEIWVYVSGDGANRNLSLALNADLRAEVIGSDRLLIGPGRWLGQQVGLFGDGAIAFPIIRVPSEHENVGPLTIRIPNARVTGTVVPHVDYHIVVSGTAFAENDQVVYHAATGVNNVLIGGLHVGVFTSLPYSAVVLTYGGGSLESAPPAGGPGQGGPGFVNRGQLVLRETMGAIESSAGLVEDPFRLVPVPGTRYAVSMLNPRVFADFIGAELDYAAGRIEFTGLDSNGTPVTVVLNVGQTTATVNGEVVDIATFAGARELANSVETMRIGDRTFVPVRFLSNAFLLPISFVSGTVTIG